MFTRRTITSLFIIAAIAGMNFPIVRAEIDAIIPLGATITVPAGANSVVDHNITVYGTLVIEPGAIVDFSFGYGITVQSSGQLIIGTSSGTQVRLYDTDDQKGGWNGITNNGGTVIIYNTSLEDANNGVTQTNGSVLLHSSILANSATGIASVGGNVRILNSALLNAGNAVVLTNVTTPAAICGNTFGSASPADYNSRSITLIGANNVDIRYNNFYDGDNFTIYLAENSINTNVRIAFNNFYHNRVTYDPFTNNFFYIVGNDTVLTSPVSVYNSYWTNTGIEYTTTAAIDGADLIPEEAVNPAAPRTDPVSGTGAGNSDTWAPTLVEVSPSLALPGTVTLTAIVADIGWGIDTATVTIRLVDQSDSSIIHIATLSSRLYTERQYIFQATVSDLILGHTYSWRVSATDYAGNTMTNAGSSYTLLVTNSINQLIAPGWAIGGGYQMITVPLATINQDHKIVLSMTQPDTIIARYPPPPGTDYLYYGNPSLESFAPGRGFWLKVSPNETLPSGGRKIDGVRVTAKVDTAVLTPGWYMIGNPFAPDDPTTTLWDLNFANLSFTYTKTGGTAPGTYRLYEAVIDGVVSFGLWGYDPSLSSYYFEREKLYRWKGYWIRIKKDTVLSFNRAAYPATPSAAGWDVQLMVTQNNVNDGANNFGLFSNANQGVDLFDSEKPPALGTSSLKSYFSPPGAAREYATDFRAHNSPKESWTYVVTGLKPGEARIAWRGVANAPVNYQLILRDKLTGVEVDLRRNSYYRFTVGQETRREFLITAQDFGAMAVDISGITISRNPFAPLRESVTVGYSLSGAASVEIKVYDWVGNLVYTAPVNVAPGPGTYSFVWNGRNANGRMVANGVYFCKIIARNGSGQGSQIVKLAVVN